MGKMEGYCLEFMGDLAKNLVCTYGTKAAAVGGGKRIWIIALQKVTAVFGNGRNALHHLVLGLKGMLSQDDVANSGLVTMVSGRV